MIERAASDKHGIKPLIPKNTGFNTRKESEDHHGEVDLDEMLLGERLVSSLFNVVETLNADNLKELAIILQNMTIIKMKRQVTFYLLIEP